MADSSDAKISDIEKGNGEEETAFIAEDETARFLNDEGKAGEESSTEVANQPLDFYGLTREELEQYANDPKWVKVRWILFAIFLVGWALMLVAAIVIVVLSPKCPPAPDLTWIQKSVLYKVDPAKYKDSDGDNMGDLKGLLSKGDHLKELSVGAVWIEPLVNPSELSSPLATVGSLDEFKQLADDFNKKGIRVVIDFPLSGAGQAGTKPDLSDGAVLDKLDNAVKLWTEAGAEGFVLQLAADDKRFSGNLTERWMTILGEYNRLDDRARVIIARDVMNTDVSVSVYQPMVNCSQAADECEQKGLEAIATAGASQPWPIIQLPRSKADKCVLCDVMKKLTIPGTPNMMYGDEIGLPSGGYMAWNDQDGHGFSESTDASSLFESQPAVFSVLAQRAAGFPGVSIYNMVKEIAEVRQTEPSLIWGAMTTHNFGGDAEVFVRHAEGFAPVIIALNYGDAMSGNLAYGDYSSAEVLAASGSSLSAGEQLEGVSAVFLPEGGAVVLRLAKPEKSK